LASFPSSGPRFSRYDQINETKVLESGKIRFPDVFSRSWLIHAKNNYPRECWPGQGQYFVARSADDFVNFCAKQYDEIEECHTSLYPSTIPDSGYTHPWVDQFIIELDGQLEQSYSAMHRIYSWLRLKLNAEPRIYFSGHRSFHIFVDFLPLVIPFVSMAELARQIGRESETLQLIDFQMYHARKLSRVPYSYNTKTARLCVPISIDWSVDEIIKESSKPERFAGIRIQNNARIRQVLASIKPEQTRIRTRTEPRKARTKANFEWIEQLLSRSLPDGRHRLALYVITPYLSVKHKQLEPALQEAERWLSLQRGTTLRKNELRLLLRRALNTKKIRFIRSIEELERQDPQLAQIVKEVLQ
jgi:hypothetical protein